MRCAVAEPLARGEVSAEDRTDQVEEETVDQAQQVSGKLGGEFRLGCRRGLAMPARVAFWRKRDSRRQMVAAPLAAIIHEIA